MQSKEEEEARLKIWRENLAHINERNADKSLGFTLAMNQFGDMSSEEFMQKMLMPAGKMAQEARKERKDTLQHPEFKNLHLDVSKESVLYG